MSAAGQAGAAPAAERSRFAAALFAIAVAGLGVRLLYALVVMHGVGVGGDGLEFHLLANQLAGGDGYVQPLVVSPGHIATADKPPLYPLLLSSTWLLGWHSFAAERVLSCLMGAATVVAAGLLGRRAAGERAGLIAAVLAALYPLLVAQDGSLRSESLYVPLTAFVLLAALRLADRPTAGRAALLGALVGAAALTRSEGVLLGVVVLGALAPRLPGGERLRPLVIAAAVAALVLSPWVARNWVVFHRPLLSNNTGSLVYGANCHAAYYTSLIGSWPCVPALTVRRRRNEADVSARLRHAGVRYARDHAGRLPAVAGVRVLRSFDLWSPGAATRLEARAGDRDLNVQRVGVLVYWLVVPLAVAGAVLLRRRRGPLALLLAPLPVVLVVTLLGYGTPRFRAPLDPSLVVLAAVALAVAQRPRAAWRRAAA